MINRVNIKYVWRGMSIVINLLLRKKIINLLKSLFIYLLFNSLFGSAIETENIGLNICNTIILFFFLKMEVIWNYTITKSYTEKLPAKQEKNTNYIMSAWIREVTQGGVTPNQKCWVPNLLASWKSSWATVLKFLLRCLKRQNSKDSLAWRIPCTMCP